jgi:diguanylate cyclase
MVERLRERIASTPFHHHGRPEQVTVSCGVTELRDGDTPESVYERADQALYKAKKEGRNRCVSV